MRQSPHLTLLYRNISASKTPTLGQLPRPRPPRCGPAPGHFPETSLTLRSPPPPTRFPDPAAQTKLRGMARSAMGNAGSAMGVGASSGATSPSAAAAVGTLAGGGGGTAAGVRGTSGHVIPSNRSGTVEVALAERLVGRCTFTPARPWVDRAWFQRLKLKRDAPLSNFACNVNLRLYRLDAAAAAAEILFEMRANSCGDGEEAEMLTQLRAVCEDHLNVLAHTVESGEVGPRPDSLRIVHLCTSALCIYYSEPGTFCSILGGFSVSKLPKHSKLLGSWVGTIIIYRVHSHPPATEARKFVRGRQHCQHCQHCQEASRAQVADVARVPDAMPVWTPRCSVFSPRATVHACTLRLGDARRDDNARHRGGRAAGGRHR